MTSEISNINNQLSPMNTKLIEAKRNTVSVSEPKIDLTQENDKLELKKKKVIKAVVISAATIAGITGLFLLAKNGKLGEGLKKHANNLWDNITSIFKNKPKNAGINTEMTFHSTKDGFVEGVKFENGKAILPDGSGFSGALVVNKGECKASLLYKDGLLKLSRHDNKTITYTYNTNSTLDKIFELYDSGLSKCQEYKYYSKLPNGKKQISGIQISNINKAGDITSKKIFKFSKDGKLKELVK